MFPEASPLLLTNGISAATRLGGVISDFSSISGPLSTLRSFFIVITASIFGVTAIVNFTGAFPVPKAAEQLVIEKDTKSLRPDLWEEYEAKLEYGEIMVNPPDLLQELGNCMQQIIEKWYENGAAERSDDSDIQGI